MPVANADPARHRRLGQGGPGRVRSEVRRGIPRRQQERAAQARGILPGASCRDWTTRFRWSVHGSTRLLLQHAAELGCEVRERTAGHPPPGTLGRKTVTRSTLLLPAGNDKVTIRRQTLRCSAGSSTPTGRDTIFAKTEPLRLPPTPPLPSVWRSTRIFGNVQTRPAGQGRRQHPYRPQRRRLGVVHPAGAVTARRSGSW